jgi:hypothetical protein
LVSLPLRDTKGEEKDREREREREGTDRQTGEKCQNVGLNKKHSYLSIIQAGYHQKSSLL